MTLGLQTALPIVLAALAAGVAAAPAPAAARARSVLGRVPAQTGGHGRDAHNSRAGPRLWFRSPMAACGAAALAVLVLVGGVPGLALATAVVVLGPRALNRLEPAAARRERQQLEADLPLALDLLSACLSGGSPVQEALEVVGRALPGACGDRLGRVASALEVGTPAVHAWALLDPDGVDRLASAAVRALGRADQTGTPVADELARLTSRAREEAAARGRAAAERAAVLAVAPLGLCFLPAFVLVGVVPVVAGLLLPLLRAF